MSQTSTSAYNTDKQQASGHITLSLVPHITDTHTTHSHALVSAAHSKEATFTHCYHCYTGGTCSVRPSGAYRQNEANIPYRPTIYKKPEHKLTVKLSSTMLSGHRMAKIRFTHIALQRLPNHGDICNSSH